MTNIEEKILDGPRIHYCDADDDDLRLDEETDRSIDDSPAFEQNKPESIFTRPDEEAERLSKLNHVRWKPSSTNTGPKGVIEDYNRRKSLQAKITKENDQLDDLEQEFQLLLNDDSILNEFISKRMSNMSISPGLPSFGQLYALESGDELLDAIDQENPNVLVMVHVYTSYSTPCSILNRCLSELATELKSVKFVSLNADETSLSERFKFKGVPALVTYRAGEFVKCLIRVDEWLDKDFDANQVKDLLTEKGLFS